MGYAIAVLTEKYKGNDNKNLRNILSVNNRIWSLKKEKK